MELGFGELGVLADPFSLLSCHTVAMAMQQARPGGAWPGRGAVTRHNACETTFPGSHRLDTEGKESPPECLMFQLL